MRAKHVNNLTTGESRAMYWPAKCIKNLWFGLMINVPVISYSHVGTVSSPNQIFLRTSLIKTLTRF